MKKTLPALVQTRGGRGVSRLALVLFLLLGRGGLDDMQRAALEGLGAHLAPGVLRLLGAAVQDLGHPLAVLAGIGDDRQGDRQLGIILADRGDRQGPLGDLEQLLERDADLFLQRVARVLQLAREVVAEVLECRVVPELPVLALAERLAQRVDVGHLDQENGGVGEDPFRGCRGLGEVRRQSGKTTQTKPSNEGQAKNRPLRHTHHLTLHSRHSAAHRPRERRTRRRHTGATTSIGRPGSKPGTSPAVTGELVSVHQVVRQPIHRLSGTRLGFVAAGQLRQIQSSWDFSGWFAAQPQNHWTRRAPQIAAAAILETGSTLSESSDRSRRGGSR